MSEKPEDQESYLFIVFLSSGPPMNLASTVDLVQVWLDAIKECRKTGDWTKPILFEEDGQVLACFSPSAILGMVRGMATNTKKEK